MRGLSYTAALADLAVLLSRVAIEQRVPGVAAAEDPMQDDIKALAAAMHPDVVQLFYSVAVHSRHELSLAPDEYAGFVMACLRMLALVPPGTVAAPPPAGTDPSTAAPSVPSVSAATGPSVQPVPDESDLTQDQETSPVPAPNAGAEVEVVAIPVSEKSTHVDNPVSDTSPSPVVPVATDTGMPPSSVPPWEDVPASHEVQEFVASDDIANSNDTALNDDFETLSVGPAVEDALAQLAPVQKKTRVPRLKRMTARDWPKLVTQLPLTGVAAELARQSEWLGADGDSIRLRMAIPTLAETSARARLCTILSEHFGAVIQLDIEYGETGDDTAHAIDQSHREELQKQAERAVQDDPFVNSLISEFGGQLVSGSVRAGV